jgi:hypothetical protein
MATTAAAPRSAQIVTKASVAGDRRRVGLESAARTATPGAFSQAGMAGRHITGGARNTRLKGRA